MKTHSQDSKCTAACTHDRRPTVGFGKLFAIILVGVVLLPTYCASAVLALPYMVTVGIVDWYIALATRTGLRK